MDNKSAYQKLWEAFEEDFLEAYADTGDLPAKYKALMDLDFEMANGENFLKVHKEYIADCLDEQEVTGQFFGDRK